MDARAAADLFLEDDEVVALALGEGRGARAGVVALAAGDVGAGRRAGR